MYLGLRVLAGALWAASLALLVVASTTQELFHATYGWSLFLAIAGLGVTLWALIDVLLSRESSRNAQLTADCVAQALRELNEDGHLRSVSSTRRGT